MFRPVLLPRSPCRPGMRSSPAGGARRPPRPSPTGRGSFLWCGSRTVASTNGRRRVENERPGHRGRTHDPLRQYREAPVEMRGTARPDRHRQGCSSRCAAVTRRRRHRWCANESENVYLTDDRAGTELLQDTPIEGCRTDWVKRDPLAGGRHGGRRRVCAHGPRSTQILPVTSSENCPVVVFSTPPSVRMPVAPASLPVAEITGPERLKTPFEMSKGPVT
jgi:hypothetical protein